MPGHAPPGVGVMSHSSGPSDGGFCYYLGVRHAEQNLTGAEASVRLNDKLSGVKNDKEIVFRWRAATGMAASQEPPKPTQLRAIFRRGATAQSPVEGQLEWDLSPLTPSPEGEVIRKLRWASTRFPDGPVHLQVVLAYAPGEPISANTTGSTTAGTGTTASTTGATTGGGTTAGTTGSTSGSSGSGGTTAGSTGGTTAGTTGGTTGTSGSGGTTGGWTVIVDPNDPAPPAPESLTPQGRTISVGTTLAAYNRVVVNATRTVFWGSNGNKATKRDHPNIPASVAPYDWSLPWPFFSGDPRKWAWPQFSIDGAVTMVSEWDALGFKVLNKELAVTQEEDRRVLLPKTVSGEIATPHMLSRRGLVSNALLDNATIWINFTHGYMGGVGDHGNVLTSAADQTLDVSEIARSVLHTPVDLNGQVAQLDRGPRRVPRFTGMLMYSCTFCATPGLVNSLGFANRDDVFIAGFNRVVQSFTFPGHREPVDLLSTAGVPIVVPIWGGAGFSIPLEPAELLTEHAEKVAQLLSEGESLQSAVSSANEFFPPRTLGRYDPAQPFIRSFELPMQVVAGSRFRLYNAPSDQNNAQLAWLRKVN